MTAPTGRPAHEHLADDVDLPPVRRPLVRRRRLLAVRADRRGGAATAVRDGDMEGVMSRACYATPCGCGKRRYKSHDAALHAALTATAKRGTPLRIYRCPRKGNGFHLTKRAVWRDAS